MVYLRNEYLTAEISETGAEIKSIKKGDCEYMWSGDPAVWGNTAPVLFPILCFLKDNKYILNGKIYKMTKHGILRNVGFTVENSSDASATLLYTQNEQTLEMYPYNFEFRAIFTLAENSLRVEYRVDNLNDCEMCFSLGAHEAYSTPDGVEDYDIIFPEKESLDSTLLNGTLLTRKTLNFGREVDTLPIYERYFELDTLIFKNLKSKKVTLKSRSTGRVVKVEFPDFPYLAVWHKQGAPFLCIEPWSGLPDNENTDYNFKTKEGIMRLEPYGQYRSIHTITV